VKILVPLPRRDFDPTEAAIPWKLTRAAGHAVVFATPDGAAARADERILTGRGLGPWKTILRADTRAVAAHGEMARSDEFLKPLRWDAVRVEEFGGMILPGGHAPGMKEYLESPLVQSFAARMIIDRPVGAICHGTIVVARARRADGKSLLHDRRTTSLLRSQELAAWALTALWLGSYYRTYPETVEDEVRRNLANPSQFEKGAAPMRRDSPEDLDAGFACLDGNYVSARWPGDAHRFAREFLKRF